MTLDMSYEAVMGRKNEIMKKAIGIDYSEFESGSLSFDYERMMHEAGYSLDEIRKIQGATGVGNTPLLELRNITALARKYAPAGKGARIFVKDEASNPS
ncbi:MAG: PLP-dependent lyase/thiolase, partial [Synergistales bacterium]|nr:PLP-dependent lyase/thiolase [Synergistales bacterium]